MATGYMDNGFLHMCKRRVGRPALTVNRVSEIEGSEVLSDDTFVVRHENGTVTLYQGGSNDYVQVVHLTHDIIEKLES